MSGTIGEIIKAESGGEQCQRVGIQELLAAHGADKREHFLRFRPDGRLPVITPPKKEPEISQEELHARRMEQLEREVYQRTFAAAEAAGLKAGEEKMEREINRLLPQLEGVLTNLSQLHVRIMAASERFLVETLMVLLRELLAYELTIHPEELTARVQRILSRASGRKKIVIYLSPGNARLLARLPGSSHLRIEADEMLSPGAVRLESDFGGLEDNLEVQLKEVELGLRAYLQERLEQSGVTDIAEQAQESALRAEARQPVPLAPDPDSVAPLMKRTQNVAPQPSSAKKPTPKPVMKRPPPSPDKPEWRHQADIEMDAPRNSLDNASWEQTVPEPESASLDDSPWEQAVPEPENSSVDDASWEQAVPEPESASLDDSPWEQAASEPESASLDNASWEQAPSEPENSSVDDASWEQAPSEPENSSVDDTSWEQAPSESENASQEDAPWEPTEAEPKNASPYETGWPLTEVDLDLTPLDLASETEEPLLRHSMEGPEIVSESIMKALLAEQWADMASLPEEDAEQPWQTTWEEKA